MLKSLVQKPNVSMGRIKRSLIFALVAATIVEQVSSQELTPNHGRAIKELGIEKNFKGFSYGVDEKHPNRLTLSLLPGAFEGKSLIGIALNLADSGGIESIEPIFTEKVKEFEPIRWAFDAFKGKEIDINTLWQIVRSTIHRDSSDLEVLFFMLNTIKSSDGFVPLEQILIPEFGPFRKAIKEIESSKGSNSAEKIRTLAELNDFLNLRNK